MELQMALPVGNREPQRSLLSAADLCIRIVVRGTPAPQGSKSFKGLAGNGRAILAESSKAVKPWRMDVKAAAEKWIADNSAMLFHGCSTGRGAVFEGPVVCRMVFTLKKPSGSPKTRRTFPMRKPDLSKLVRSTEDALTDAGIWSDDARVVEYGRLAKVFPGEDPEALAFPGALIEIRAIGAA